MKKIHVFPVLVFACSVVIVSSCNQPDNDPGLETNHGLSVDAVIEKHNLKRLSEGQTSEMLKAGNFLNFETAAEADAFLTEMVAAGKKGIHVKGKVDSKQTRSGTGNQQIITVPLFSAGGLDDFSKLAATSNSDDGAGSTGLTRDWGAGADLRVVVSWNSGYTGINTTAYIESVANYNTWEN